MPKGKENFPNFFLDVMGWLGYNELMNGEEWFLAVRPWEFLIRSRAPNVEKKIRLTRKNFLTNRLA